MDTVRIGRRLKGWGSGIPVRQRGRKHMLAAAAGLALTAALVGCSSGSGSSSKAGSASSSATTSVTVAYPGNSASLPVMVAISQGFFTQHHLKVTSRVLTDITQIVPLLGRGVDFGFGTEPSFLHAVSTGLNLIEVANNELVPLSNTEYALFAAKNSNITSVSQLAGKTIGAATLAGNINLATKYTLQKDGVNVNSIHFVQVLLPDVQDQLAAGRVDAAEAAEPFTSILLHAGFRLLTNSLQGLPNPASMSLWLSQKSWAESHKQVVQDYVAALNEADSFIQAHPNQSRHILAAATGISYAKLAESKLSNFSTNPAGTDLAEWEKILGAVGGLNISTNPASLIMK